MPRPNRPRAGATSPAARTRPRSVPRLDLLAAIAIVLLVYLPHLRLAATEHLTPDAAGYLDMGRNLISGRGAVTTYNLYQYWPGTDHPTLPYMQPLYPLVCGLLWKVDGLRGVVSLNILLFALNCALVYLLARRMIGRPAAFLASLLLGISPSLLLSAIHPWTEQLHLLTLLWAVLVLAHGKTPGFWIGVLLGAGCLVRFAGLYNVAALLVAVLVLHGFRSSGWKEFALILAGFLAIAVPYELFCLFRYGKLYPEYLAAAKRYTIAVASGGASYHDVLPVLRVAAEPALAAGALAGRIGSHLAELLKAFGPAAALALTAPLGFVMSGALRREPRFLVLVCLGVFSLLGYAVSLAWTPGIEAARYSIVPIVTLVPAGLAALRGAATRWLGVAESRFSLGTLAVVAILIGLTFPGHAGFMWKHEVEHPGLLRHYRVAREDIHGWIRTHAPAGALVASEFLKDPIYFERPFVALPAGKALEPAAFESFLAAYSPDYILFANPRIASFLAARSDYRLVRRNDLLVLVERRRPGGP